MKKILYAYDLVENDNEYMERMVEISKTIENLEVVSSLNEFWKPTTHYNAIVINWPDYLFRWKRNISDSEVEKLQSLLEYYKKCGTKIITVLHDEYAHRSRSENRNLIFDICFQNSNILAHLGEFSQKEYSEKFKNLNIKHKLLYHPKYKYFNFDLNKENVRKAFGFKPKDFIIIVPGGIRHQYEEDYVNKIFNNIKIKHKKLIYLRATHIDKPIKKITSRRFIFFKLKERYIQLFHKRVYKYKFLDSKILSEYFTAADLVILPRIDILNSGNVILGSQFNKLIIGPKIGNINEWLLKFNHISILPSSVDNKSFSETITTEIKHHLENQSKHTEISYITDQLIAQQLSDILFN
ncbi:hypothetical protein IQ37_00330 [Chryseobacterium piperi]|uniref:Glycosyltransferase n=1 Tax=Chryseobacterium piperi TaxID=558152 RepID=A0A086BMV0_9FLAO|nr:hypothetical protein [Chryseobacterium piperi]ASW75058.1 hypothetical protein CJF12_12735 [Chryseobacterium piperi]KFF30264.1 hypothetical protein IQ37_00330 [Chryseobacterium piperi]